MTKLEPVSVIMGFMSLTMIGGVIALQHLGGVRGLFLALC
jgi:hypothetical protein